MKSDIRRTKSGKAYVYSDFTYVNTRWEKNLLRMVDVEARKENRKRSNMIREMCRRYLMEKGMIENVEGYNY